MIIPQKARINSTASPAQKKIDGIPSASKLIILPAASPHIKKTFEIVAVRQKADLNIPIHQRTSIAKYKPIVALNTCFRLILSTIKSKRVGKKLPGDKP